MTISTSNLSDLYESDLLYLDSVFKSYGLKSWFSGSAVPIQCYEDSLLIEQTLQEPGKSKVLIIDAGGSLNRAVFDEKLAEIAVKNGWEGVIINGTIRGSKKIEEIELGVKALGECVRKAGRNGTGEKGGEVEIAGGRLKAGDIVMADGDGIVIFGKKKTTMKIKPKF